MKKFTKFTRKLMFSIITCLFTLIALGTSTFAWFSMNQKVAVTGMEIKTVVNDNLFIANSTGVASTTKSADSNFRNALHYTTGEVSLQPVSSINAKDFFYTNNAAADGHKIEGNYTALSNNTITINTVDYKGYADYVFELKAINASESTKYVNLTKLNILYDGSSENVTHAFRVAVFVQEQADTSTELAATEVTSAYAALNNTSAIFAKSDFDYFTSGEAVSAVNATAAVNPIVNSTSISKSVAAGKTLYFKVTVRIWLEGEDKDCYNTKFVDLTSKWSLDLAFELQNSGATLITLGASANATIESNGDTLTAALANDLGEVASTYAWYKVGGDGSVVATTATYAPGDTAEYYCVITTAKGNEYRTPAIHYFKEKL